MLCRVRQNGELAANYLHKHYRQQNTVEVLSHGAALNRGSLHRLFRQQTGMTIVN